MAEVTSFAGLTVAKTNRAPKTESEPCCSTLFLHPCRDHLQRTSCATFAAASAVHRSKPPLMEALVEHPRNAAEERLRTAAEVGMEQYGAAPSRVASVEASTCSRTSPATTNLIV